MANAIKCKTCSHCEFLEINGRPNRYYCGAVKDGCMPDKLICKTERHSKEFTIKRTPKWCPFKEDK